MYSLNEQVGNFILALEKQGYDLFPYLPNSNWKEGDPIYYSGPYWDDQEPTAAITALLTGKWLPAGENVNKFERAFSKQFEFDFSVMVNSGSSANLVMIAALKKYFDWKDGDEILVCACGFPTTINPIIQNGLKPVFVDINEDDLIRQYKVIREELKQYSEKLIKKKEIVVFNKIDLLEEKEKNEKLKEFKKFFKKKFYEISILKKENINTILRIL